jgi:hypothetical protein
MRRMVKVVAAALGFLLYLWFAAVKNLDLVKKRKRMRDRT